LDIGDEFAFCGGKEKLFRHLGIDKPTSKLTAADTERLSAVALLESQGVFKDYHKENCQRIGKKGTISSTISLTSFHQMLGQQWTIKPMTMKHKR